MFPGIPTLLWSPTSLFIYLFVDRDCCRQATVPCYFSEFFFSGQSPSATVPLQYVVVSSPPEDLPVPYTTQKPSIISTGLLKPLLTFHLRPIQQVVSLRSYTFQSRELILKRVSHLDAFSGYLFRTWLLSDAPGGTTDTPEVRPPRSSRTRGSPSQFSFAHSG